MDTAEADKPSDKALGFTPSGKPRLHQCQICLRSFARLEHLKRHERSHTKEKPFHCGVCSRRFSRRDLLLRHAEKLHGGCADAVKRLRRRRRSATKEETPSYSSLSKPTERLEGPPMSTFITGGGGAMVRSSSVVSSISGNSSNNTNNINHNVNSLFNNIKSNGGGLDDLDNLKENDDDISPFKRRRASFSASSGENYAMPKYPNINDQFSKYDGFNNNNNNNNYNGENYLYGGVEFSTPQVTPLVNEKLSNIPEISLASESRTSNVFQLNLDNQDKMDIDKKVNDNDNEDRSRYGHYDFYGIESPNGENWVNNVIENSHVQILSKLKNASNNIAKQNKGIEKKINDYQNQLSKISAENSLHSTGVNNSPAKNKDEDFNSIYGYSFYTDDIYGDKISDQLKNNYGFGEISKKNSNNNQEMSRVNNNSGDSEINQEYDMITDFNNLQNFQFFINDDHNDKLLNNDKNLIEMDRDDSGKSTNSTQTMLSSGSSNPMLSSNRPEPFFQHFNNISNGYSYYEALPLADQSNSNDFMGYSLATATTNNNFDDLTNDNVNNAFGNTFSKISITPKLFTPFYREKIKGTLLKYPFIGIPSPSITDNDKLNEYVESFKNGFSNHLPFIHPWFLNEENMLALVSNKWEGPNKPKDFNIYNDELKHSLELEKTASESCLPLLIAAIGAMVSNEKYEASNLYEASRRCIHVYLEARKANNQKKSINQKVSPSSPLWLIQSLTLSVIYGLFAENEICSPMILKQVYALVSLIRSSKLLEAEFLGGSNEEYLVYQSKLRTIYILYDLSILLNYFYGVTFDTEFKFDELKIALPDSEEIFFKLPNYIPKESEKPPNFKFSELFRFFIEKDFKDSNIGEFNLLTVQFALQQYCASKILKTNSKGEIIFFKNWENCYGLPIEKKNIDETHNNDHKLFLKFDSLLLNDYLKFKSKTNEIPNIRTSGVWNSDWKTISNYFSEILFKNEEIKNKDDLNSIKFAIKIFINVFFKKEANDELILNQTLKIDDKFDEYIKVADNIISDKKIISKVMFKKLVSLNLIFLIDPILILLKFCILFEKDCDKLDSGILKLATNVNIFGSIFNNGRNGGNGIEDLFNIELNNNINNDNTNNTIPSLFNNNSNKKNNGTIKRDVLLEILHDQNFLERLKHYKLIIKLFEILKIFLMKNYNKSLPSPQYSYLQKFRGSLMILKISSSIFEDSMVNEFGFYIFKDLGHSLNKLKKNFEKEIILNHK